MGSFNATCIVSGLPITAGARVRFFALTQNEYHRAGNDHACSVTGRWQLRTVPLRGEYNDYGSVDKIEPGLTERVFFKSFDRDVIEKGFGDNKCHDTPVRKGMSPDKWLEALWEGRVFVRSGSEMRQLLETTKAMARAAGAPARPRPKLPKGIPSLKRIEAALSSAKLPLAETYGDQGYYVDLVRRGYVRVRSGVYGAGTAELDPVVQAIRAAGFAAMVTAGTAPYADTAEVLVAPLPGTSRLMSGVGKPERCHPRPVSQAMVLEGVWQALLACSLDDAFFDSPKPTMKAYVQGAMEYLAKHIELKDRPDRFVQTLLLEEHDEAQASNRVALHLAERLGSSGFGLREAASLACELPHTKEELAAFAQDLAETCWAETAYSALNGQWGPQDTPWKLQKRFRRQIALLTDMQAAQAWRESRAK